MFDVDEGVGLGFDLWYGGFYDVGVVCFGRLGWFKC